MVPEEDILLAETDTIVIAHFRHHVQLFEEFAEHGDVVGLGPDFFLDRPRGSAVTLGGCLQHDRVLLCCYHLTFVAWRFKLL